MIGGRRRLKKMPELNLMRFRIESPGVMRRTMPTTIPTRHISIGRGALEGTRQGVRTCKDGDNRLVNCLNLLLLEEIAS